MPRPLEHEDVVCFRLSSVPSQKFLGIERAS
jgi:hypothetical protein